MPIKTLTPHIVLTSFLMLLLGSPLFSDSRESDETDKTTGNELSDCPQMDVLGSGGMRVMSLSERGFLGVETSSLTPELRQHFGVPDDAGLMISRVVENSAAAKAGLEVGDIVTRVDGEKMTSVGRLGSIIRRQTGGEAVDIEYWRDGQRDVTQATPEKRKRCAFDVGSYLDGIDLEHLPHLGALGLQISGDAFEISGEALENAMESMREALENQDWEHHFEDLKGLDLDQVEQHLERVQRRLERLENRLEREYGQDLENDDKRHHHQRHDQEKSDNNTL